jgi:hypothetical protein
MHTKRFAFSILSLLVVLAGVRADELEDGFANPPRPARVRAYWWWLNGNVTSNAITRDLEAMKAKGFGGALICDADGASQDGNDRVPHGPTFFSPEWRALYRHCLSEAGRLGLEMSLNIQSSWNLGGPMVPPEDAPKKLVWSAHGQLGSRGGELDTDTTRGVSAPARLRFAAVPARHRGSHRGQPAREQPFPA